MTVSDEDNPMLNEAYRKKLREEKKSPLRPLTSKEIKAAFGRMKEPEPVAIKVSPYVQIKDLNHSSEELSIRPKPAIEVGIKINF